MPSTSAFLINPIWDPSLLGAFNAAQIETAVNLEIQVLEKTFTNAVTINLHVGWGETDGLSIGNRAVASGGFNTHSNFSYATVASALIARGVSMPTVDPDTRGVVSLSEPNAEALGLSPNAPVEGYVGFSNTVNWDFSGSSSISAGAYDFAGVVAHEITHVMGRYTSGNAAYPWLLDLFRFSAPGVLDISHAQSSDYFSADGGVTVGQYFSATADRADWSGSIATPDSFGEAILGQQLAVTPIDLKVLGDLGWTLASPVDYPAIIKNEYDVYFGRDPTAAETAVWVNALDTGAYSIAGLRTALLNDPTGQAHTNAEIKSLYDTYFGRDPQSSELAAWQGLIGSGYDFTGLRTALLNDATGHAHTNAEITSLYDTYFGRDPQASELTAWQGLIASGYDFNGLRTALLGDPTGQAHTTAEIKLLYDTFFGRDPGASEVAAWQNVILNDGYDFTGMRTFLLNDPAGAAHTNAEITSLYDYYFGRDPQASESAAWQGLISSGYDFNGLRTALLNDPTGIAHTDTQIVSLYDTYFGRDPQASELTAWQGLIASGYDFTGLRAALLNDPSGQAHTNATITSLYDTYFGRDPLASEMTAWQGLIAGGDDFHQMRDVLERDPGSVGIVTHIDAAGAATVTPAAGWQTVALANFDAASSQIALSAALFAGVNPLDPAHALQIASPLGGEDVLVTLDAVHSLLIENVALTSLHASDFLFI